MIEYRQETPEELYEVAVLAVLKQAKEPLDPVDFIDHFEVGARDVATRSLRVAIWKATGEPIRQALYRLVKSGRIVYKNQKFMLGENLKFTKKEG
jgi:hypothetical protein